MLAHDFICSVLRDDVSPYPAQAGEAFERELFSLAQTHGVLALLHDRASSRGEFAAWPQHLRKRLDAASKAQAVRELLVKRELVSLLERLAEAGVSALLLKGTPLAYTLYPKPYLRTRCDTDILIPESQFQLAHEVLVHADYAPDLPYRKMVSYQAEYRHRSASEIELAIDLHWRLSNLQYFAWAFDFDELHECSVQASAVWRGARAPAPLQALLIACMHRATNISAPGFDVGIDSQEPNRLIWLYDIHLLCGRLSAVDWARLVEIATVKGVRAICLDALRVTSACFGTLIPDSVMDRLAAPGRAELSAGYLKRGSLRSRMIDLRSLPDWRRRRDLLADWAFPSVDHMLARYAVHSRWLLPLLYIRRALEISSKLLRPDRAPQ